MLSVSTLRLSGLVGLGLWALIPPAASAAQPLVQMRDVIQAREGQVRDLAFAGDGLTATRSVDGAPPEVTLWSTAGGQALGPGQSSAISPDRRWRLVLVAAEWRLENRVTGEVRRFSLPATASAYFGSPVWSADSHTVAAHYDLPTGGVADPNPIQVEGAVRFQDLQPAAPAPASAHLYNQPYLLFWSVASAQPKVRALGETESYAGSWRDGHTYLYAAGDHDYGGQAPFTAIRALDLNTGLERELYRTPVFNQTGHPRISPDGRWLAVGLDLDTPRFGVAPHILLLDLKTGAARRLAGAFTISQLEWGRDGWIYFTCRAGGLQPLMRVHPDGRVQPVVVDGLDHRNLARSATGDRLAYTTEDGQGRITLRVRSLTDSHDRVQAVLADPTQHFALGKLEAVTWTGAGGVGLHGFLIYPPDFDPRRRYPLFVDIHGTGPGAALSLNGGMFGWRGAGPLEWHAWAALGYVVFVPDYRSSGEYGAAINCARTEADDGDVSGIQADARDVEAGVRHILQAAYLDPGRVVLFGHSAGGGRANWLLTRSSLFAAAILHDPIPSGPDADLLTRAAKGLPATWSRAAAPAPLQTQLGADFLFDGWRVSTPTLLIVGDPAHGALDPISAETFYALLTQRHVPTRLIRYLDDGHVPANPEIALHQFDQMRAWLVRYAPPGPAA